MATITNFAGEIIIEPGAYSEITGTGTPDAAIDTFGNVILIDTGIGAGFGSGAGVNGQNTTGLSSLKDFFTPLEMKNALKGGVLWDLVDYLWSPSTSGNGPQKVSFIKAATTTGAQYVLPLQVDSSHTVINSITIRAKNEGTFGNGVLTGQVLTRGYGVKIKAGVVNPNKFILEFFEGQFKGLDPNGVAYDLTEAELQAVGANTIVCQTGEFSGFNELINILNTDKTIQKYFTVVTTVGNDFQLFPTILIQLPGINLFSGGTTVYNSTDVDDVLDAIADVDNDMFLALDYDLDQSPVASSTVVTPPVLTKVSTPSTGGYFGTGSYYWVMTSFNDKGETLPSNEITTTFASGSTNMINFSAAIGTGTTGGIRLYRGTTTGVYTSYFELEASHIPSNGTLLISDMAYPDIPWYIYTGLPGFVVAGSIAIPTTNTATVIVPGSTANGNNKGALAVANAKILNYITQTSTYTEKTLYIGGNSNDFDAVLYGSLQLAQSYNSPEVVIVHSGIEIPTDANNSDLFETKPSLYSAALVCGRIAGLQPQVPGTWKDVRISGVTSPLTKSDRERALKGGVLHFKQIGTSWVINQSINTMQINTDIVDTSGNSPEISVMRIKHQINKELKQSAGPLFVGGNQFTTSDAEVTAFTENFLQQRTVIPGKQDNLIMGYKNIAVSQNNGRKLITYCFLVNEPDNQLLFTGTMFDSRVTF